MLEILPHERWHELEEIFRTEFDATLPNKTSSILADIDETGKIHGFVVLEFIGRIGQIYQGGARSREMFDFFDKQIPSGNSVIAIAHEPRFEKLCESFGMRKVEGVVYRKDY